MSVRLRSIVERLRGSLFLVPMVAVVLAIGLASLSIGVDSGLESGGADLPLGLTSTVESARALLGAIAGATITFAGIAFSVSLLIIQQASNQYSPRVVHTLFRDRFNKRIMGLVVGTFTYCLLILRSVRTSLEEGGQPVIPNLSVGIAVVLGIVTILGIVAFIDHSAHSMDISNILRDVERESVATVRREWVEPDAAPAPPTPTPPPSAEKVVHTVRFTRSGWIQQLDLEALAGCLPPGRTIWVEAQPGRYAIEGTAICHLSMRPDDLDTVERDIRATVATGATQTMQQDVSFGVRQLTDVTLKALSPGINDPTTAQDAIFHAAAVLAQLLARVAPSPPTDGAVLVLMHQPDHAALVDLAFDEVRRAAASLPTVCVYLLEAIWLIAEVRPEVSVEAHTALRRQAQLVVAGCAMADNLAADVELVENAYTTRFGGGTPR